MFRFALTLFSCVALLAVAALAPSLAAAAEEINVESAAVSFREVDGKRIVTLLRFRATSREFSLSSPYGVYDESTEMMTASAIEGERAVLVKSGENAFEVSAADAIAIHFENETLSATGDVIFRSDELDAWADELYVDRRSALEERIMGLVARIRGQETAELVQAFLAKIAPDDRLILLSGSVRLEREDSTMESSWMLVNEADQNEMISVAEPERTVRLTIVTREDEAGAEPQQ